MGQALLFTAVLMGLAGTPHCLAMCGVRPAPLPWVGPGRGWLLAGLAWRAAAGLRGGGRQRRGTGNFGNCGVGPAPALDAAARRRTRAGRVAVLAGATTAMDGQPGATPNSTRPRACRIGLASHPWPRLQRGHWLGLGGLVLWPIAVSLAGGGVRQFTRAGRWGDVGICGRIWPGPGPGPGIGPGMVVALDPKTADG